GAGWDAESDGIPNAGASGDDTTDDWPDDEDGVVFWNTPWTAGDTEQIQVTITGPGSAGESIIAGWFDWNSDGDFTDTGEWEVWASFSNPGTYTMNVSVPSDAIIGSNGIYARFRLAPLSQAIEIISPTSSQIVCDGEVEDYLVSANPTWAMISGFTAREVQGRVVVEWQTDGEIRTVGFYLHRLDEDTGKYVQVNDRMLPGLLVHQQGGKYQYVDEEARPGETYTYRLVEVEADGNRHTYGPYTVTAGEETMALSRAAAPMEDRQYDKRHHEMSGRKTARLEARAAEQTAFKKASSRAKNAASNTCKIAVKADGLYYLEASAIADAMGKSEKKIKTWIKKARLKLSRQGDEVAWLAAAGNKGLYFYGESIESIYTDTNIYWLEKGKKGSGLEMAVIKGRGPDAPAPDDQTFIETLHVEEDHSATAGLFNDPEGDYWLWACIIGDGSMAFTLPSPGVAGAGTAALTIHLKGGTNDPGAPPDHCATVALEKDGSADVTLLDCELNPDGRWDGLSAPSVQMSVDASDLNDGANTVRISGVLWGGAEYSIFYVDSFDLSYPRRYVATGDTLLVRGDGNEVVTVSGLSSKDIVVFDLENAGQPQVVNAVSIGGRAGNFQVSFLPAGPDVPYLVVIPAAARTDADIRPDAPSSLADTNNKGAYVVISPAELMAAAQGLADYRKAGGMKKTMVVDLEDVYDEFNFGIASPHAVKGFISHAYHHWKTPPRYVVFVGEGTFDPKDNKGYGEDLFPILMTSTPYGLYACDNCLADVSGDDGVPEVAVGRLPFVTSKEVDAYVAKLAAYEEAAGDWVYRVLMVADKPDDPGSSINHFPVDSDDVAALVPAGYEPIPVYVPDYNNDPDLANKALMAELNAGVAYFNYIGHSGIMFIGRAAGDDALFSYDDVSLLVNGPRLPVAVLMTCVAGRFELAGYDCLAEGLLLDEDDGAVAVWSPTGLSLNAEAKILDQALFEAVFQDGHAVLGDAVVQALGAYEARGGAPF
ncbi:MAG: hypothetical protein JRF65_11715, partial [Deltaproteobacteria bacterium]|nr:hypothetical protein [Deltaproteobacteria bacterium]